jgi:hypothetical protein
LQEYKRSLYSTIKCKECKEEFVINNAVNVTQAGQLTEILLDNQADISILHPALLTDIHWAEKKT